MARIRRLRTLQKTPSSHGASVIPRTRFSFDVWRAGGERKAILGFNFMGFEANFRLEHRQKCRILDTPPGEY